MDQSEEKVVVNWWKQLDKDNIFFIGFITGIMSIAIVFLMFYFV